MKLNQPKSLFATGLLALLLCLGHSAQAQCDTYKAEDAEKAVKSLQTAIKYLAKIDKSKTLAYIAKASGYWKKVQRYIPDRLGTYTDHYNSIIDQTNDDIETLVDGYYDLRSGGTCSSCDGAIRRIMKNQRNVDTALEGILVELEWGRDSEGCIYEAQAQANQLFKEAQQVIKYYQDAKSKQHTRG